MGPSLGLLRSALLDGPRGAFGQASLWGLTPEAQAFLHDLSDLAIFASYVTIAGLLAYFYLRARADLPFNWVFVAFSTFIVSCGFTHLMHVLLNRGAPVLVEAATVQMITVGSSAATAAILPFVLPRALMLVREARVSGQRLAEVEARDEFLAVAAHELRTPLTGVHGFIQLAARRAHTPGTDAVLAEYLDRATRESKRVNELVEALLDVALIDVQGLQVSPRPTDVSEIVCEVVAAMRPGPEHQIRVSAPDSCVAPVDPVRFPQVIRNLLNNAIKFSPGGGPVDVVVEPDGDRVVVRVRDYGEGIPDGRLSTIFEKYRRGDDRANQPGLGLGLYVAREIVVAHGGTLDARNAVGAGAVFELSLPGRAAAAVTPRGAPSPIGRG